MRNPNKTSVFYESEADRIFCLTPDEKEIIDNLMNHFKPENLIYLGEL